MNENLIILFTKNPKLGNCKTRLAKTIGNENALAVYKILLSKTANTIDELNFDKAIYYSEKIRTNDIWNDHIYQKHKQEGEDLGIRMSNAFKNSFEMGYKKVLLVGTDIYDLNQDHIETGFKALTNNDVVIGPAEDGGYYLIGLKKSHSSVFKNKQWGTETVRQDTLNNLKNQKVHLLEVLNDIDVYDDLKNNLIFEPYL